MGELQGMRARIGAPSDGAVRSFRLSVRTTAGPGMVGGCAGGWACAALSETVIVENTPSRERI